MSTPSVHLSEDLTSAVEKALQDWTVNGKVRRLWAGDASLWTNRDESNWLGWMGATQDPAGQAQLLQELREEVKRDGLTHILLLGMGGSSLCPEVLKGAFGRVDGFPELFVLDSTDPQQIASLEKRVDLSQTLFIISSKSGSTLETHLFKQYFFGRMEQEVGKGNAGSHFMAVTDPGSHLQEEAEADGFRHIFFGLPDIGGRYSALSNFGMVPATAMGLDIEPLLERADEMAVACSPGVSVKDNPGVVLGVVLGVCSNSGRDKVTLLASQPVQGFGAWLEQLLAESTGKNGKGLIPVDREEPGLPEVYSGDRRFVYVRMESGFDPNQDELVEALEKAGHPVVRISLRDEYDLGREFFRWEVATAVAGSMMGLNPFDQPDVEASKVKAQALTSEYEKSGALPSQEPFFEEYGIQLFAATDQAAILQTAAGSSASLVSILRAHLERLDEHDYFAILAYLQMNSTHDQHLQRIRMAVRDQYRVATCLGFGPRFLHSTGQAYKGGPNSGVFLQITGDDESDLQVPGHRYTFGVVKAAQAGGDFQVLNERGRRVLRVHLPKDTSAGLIALSKALLALDGRS